MPGASPEAWAEVSAPERDGIYWVDMETCEQQLAVSLGHITAFEPQPGTWSAVKSPTPKRRRTVYEGAGTELLHSHRSQAGGCYNGCSWGSRREAVQCAGG